MSHSPIFIIGAARSGTKFLRDCLLGDPRICAVPYDVNYIWRYGAATGSDDVLTPEGLDPRRSGFIRTAIARQARLKPGGRLAVISFHSLEDRIVKQFINRHAKAPPGNRRMPVDVPFTPDLRDLGGAMRATPQEVKDNPRARSAVLRVAEKLDMQGEAA